MPVWPAFALGVAGWAVIIYEIFAGEAGNAAKEASEAVQSAFSAMRWIVLVGWIIYPIGYMAGVMMGDGLEAAALNQVYNLADFVNKILFGLIIWNLAVKDSGQGAH